MTRCPRSWKCFILRISTVWPRCRSGAVGSKPTFTTSGLRSLADRSSFARRSAARTTSTQPRVRYANWSSMVIPRNYNRSMAPPERSLRLSRRAVLKGLAGVGIGAATGTFAHGLLYERHHVEVTRAALDFQGLPESLEGLKIGFLSDLHRSPTVPHQLIDAAVQAVLREQPD